MDEARLQARLLSLGIGLTPAQIRSLVVHLRQIRLWNERLNLVADAEAAEVVRRHLMDSLLGLRSLPAARGSQRLRVVDVGSGGGFPGLVAAAVRPGWEVTLLDSSSKKAGFLLGAAEAMGLSNVRVVRARAEEMGRGLFAGEPAFDVCLSRAVAPVKRLARLCSPLLATGGICGWWKGPGAVREMQQGSDSVRTARLRVVRRYLYWLPGEDISRAILVLRRLGAISCGLQE